MYGSEAIEETIEETVIQESTKCSHLTAKNSGTSGIIYSLFQEDLQKGSFFCLF